VNDSLIHSDRYSEAGGECNWIKSKICWNYTIDGLFTPIQWGRETCDKFEDDLTEHKKIMGPENIVSYPLISKFGYEERYHQFVL